MKANVATPATRELLVQRVLQALLEPRDRKVTKVLLVRKVLLVPQDPQVPTERMV
jgi:hypothetical protein